MSPVVPITDVEGKDKQRCIPVKFRITDALSGMNKRATPGSAAQNLGGAVVPQVQSHLLTAVFVPITQFSLVHDR